MGCNQGKKENERVVECHHHCHCGSWCEEPISTCSTKLSMNTKPRLVRCALGQGESW